MRVNPMTPEQREKHLAQKREAYRKKRQILVEEQAAFKAEARRKIAAAILVAEMLQESNGRQ